MGLALQAHLKRNCKSCPAALELAQEAERGFKCRLVSLLVWDLWATYLITTRSMDGHERLCGNCHLVTTYEKPHTGQYLVNLVWTSCTYIYLYINIDIYIGLEMVALV